MMAMQLRLASLLPLVFVATVAATTWKSLDIQCLVIAHAELIVGGKVIAAEKTEPGQPQVVTIQVADVMYGPKVATLRLKADSRR
jgi:hypothetical protein